MLAAKLVEFQRDYLGFRAGIYQDEGAPLVPIFIPNQWTSSRLMDPDDERSRQRRHRTLKGGRIIFNDGSSVLTCTVRDLSETGAQLQFSSLVGIPHEFELAVDAAAQGRLCRVAWRKEGRMGVAFIDALDAPAAAGAARASNPASRTPTLVSAYMRQSTAVEPEAAAPAPAATPKAASREPGGKRTLFGLWAPVTTPFRDDRAIDPTRLIRHCRQLLKDGAHGLAVLGTTSEANSLTLEERRRVIDALVEAEIPPDSILPGTGACAVEDAITLTRHAGEIGAPAVLLLPPFYYKNVSDDGLFTFVSQVIEKAGAKVPRILLYHIPPVAVVGWSMELVGRLIEAFPGVVVGMKDSSGDFEHIRRMIKAFPGFVVFPGAETTLVQAMSLGAGGCISATANINARGIRAVYDRWKEADAHVLQDEINAVRQALERSVMIPALKAVLAVRYGDPAWGHVRPPLVALAPKARHALFAEPAVAPLLETL
jgi:4-hydroxy-tetrahydrodipicolinate synthase